MRRARAAGAGEARSASPPWPPAPAGRGHRARNAPSPRARVARRLVDRGEDEVEEIAKPILTDFDILLDDAVGGMITSIAELV
jgi:hypothetical protein